MRPARLVLCVLVGAGGACTTFNFPRPGDGADGSTDATASDAIFDAPTDAGGDDGGASFLGLDDATRLCAQLFRCPRVPEAIELSMGLPLATPASPLNFSACMDWVAGPVDPTRPGLAQQQSILLAVATAPSCAEAATTLPVQPVRTDAATCTPGCADAGALTLCSPAGLTFSASCSNTAWFPQSGDCFGLDGGEAGILYDCVSLGSCPAGLSCIDSVTLRECYPTQDISFTAWNCALSGRQCASNNGHAAACVAPGKFAPPCSATALRDTCDGTAVVHCAGGFMPQTELECAIVNGGSCSTKNGPGVARCVRPGDACTPFDSDENQCTGDTITTCIAGVKQTIDCTSIGAKCLPADNTHTAHCG